MVEFGKIYWHGGHYKALQLELYEYADVLEFREERPLSDEALRMDVLIIKKNKDVQIEKNIGRIFRTHNIVEFKSESDSFSRWDYNKILGYAFIYSAFEQVPMSNITLTISLTMYPRDLVKYLKNDCRLHVTGDDKGIYYIEGGIVPIQILESKKLPAESNIFLRNLRSNLTAADILETFKCCEKITPLNEKNVYLDRIIRANPIAIKEVKEMTEAAWKIIEEAEWFTKREAEKEVEKNKVLAEKMLLRGISVEGVSEDLGLPIEMVASIANKLGAIPAA